MSYDLTLQNIIKEYFSDMLRIKPELGIEMDINVGSGLSNMSIETLDRERGLIELTLDKLKDIDFEELSIEGKAYYLSFYDYLKLRKFFLDEWQIWRMYPEALENIVKIIGIIISNPKYPLDEKIKMIGEYINDLPSYLEMSKTRLKRPVRLFVDMGILMITYLKQILAYIKDEAGKDPKSTKAFSKLSQVFERSEEALDKYMDWLVNLRGREIFEVSMGFEAFEKLIKIRRLGNDLWNVHNFIKEDINEIHDEIIRRLRNNNLSSINDYLESIREMHPTDPYKIVSEYENSFIEIRRRLLESDLIDIPDIDIDIQILPVKSSYMTPLFSYIVSLEGSKLHIEVMLRIRDDEDLKWHNKYETTLRMVRDILPGKALLEFYLKTSPNLIRKILDIPEYKDGWGAYAQDILIDLGLIEGEDYKIMNLIEKYKMAILAKMDIEVNTGRLTHVEAAKGLKQLGIFTDDEITINIMTILASPSTLLSQYLGYRFFKNLEKKLKVISEERFKYKWLTEKITRYSVTPLNYLEALILKDYSHDMLVDYLEKN